MKKNLKNILWISLSIYMMIGLVSCDSFLEEDARNQRKELWSSADDGFSAINVMYRKGVPKRYDQSIYPGTNMMCGGYMSGFFDNQYKGQEVFVQHCQELNVLAGADNNYLLNHWQNGYETIVRNANYALENLPTCPGLTDADRTQLTAEAKFFRALNYFHLVKLFGAIPLIDYSYQSLSQDLYVKRSSEAKIYELIVKDLTDALSANLADKPMPSNGFRVSKGSVAALLADVYLNMAGFPVSDASKYASAAEIAKSLIVNTNYGLIEHTKNATGTITTTAFEKLITSDTEREYLYTVEYDASIANGGSRPMYCFPNTAATWGEFPKYSISNNAYQPDTVLQALYSTDDIRYEENQYFHRTYTTSNAVDANKNPITYLLANGTAIPNFWWEKEASLSTGVSTKDQVHYRLAEMYLIAAEALVMKDNAVTDEAAGYLATIMARASRTKDASTIKTSLMALSKQKFIEEVWKEKIRELIFENKIWNDITRTRQYPAFADATKTTVTFIDLIGAKNPWGYTFATKDLYFPIPESEQQRNPALADTPL